MSGQQVERISGDNETAANEQTTSQWAGERAREARASVQTLHICSRRAGPSTVPPVYVITESMTQNRYADVYLNLITQQDTKIAAVGLSKLLA